MSDLTLRTLRSLLPDDMEIVYVENNYPLHDGEQVLVYEDQKELMDSFIKDIEQGLKSVFCSDTKKLCIRMFDKVTKLHPDKAILSVNGDHVKWQFPDGVVRKLHKVGIETNPQDLVAKLNTVLEHIDVLVYSPTLGSGFDLTTEVDSISGVFSNNLIPSVNLQQFGRIRHAKQRKLYRTDNGEQGEVPSFMYGVSGGYEAAKEAAEFFRKQGLRVNPNPTEQGWILDGVDKLCGDLYKEVGWKQHTEKTYGNALLEQLLENDGYSIVPVLSKNKEFESIKEVLNPKAPVPVADILAAEQIEDEGEVLRFSAQGSRTFEEYCQLERHRMESFYQEPISEELIRFDDNRKTMYGILAYSQAQLTEEELMELDSRASLRDAASFLKFKSWRKELLESALPYLTPTGKLADLAFNQQLLKSRGFDKFLIKESRRLQKCFGKLDSEDLARAANKLLRTLGIKTKRIKMRKETFGKTFSKVSMPSGKTVPVYRLDTKHWQHVTEVIQRRPQLKVEIRQSVSGEEIGFNAREAPEKLPKVTTDVGMTAKERLQAIVDRARGKQIVIDEEIQPIQYNTAEELAEILKGWRRANPKTKTATVTPNNVVEFKAPCNLRRKPEYLTDKRTEEEMIADGVSKPIARLRTLLTATRGHW